MRQRPTGLNITATEPKTIGESLCLHSVRSDQVGIDLILHAILLEYIPINTIYQLP